MTDENRSCGCSSMTHSILMTLAFLALAGLLYMDYAKPAATAAPPFNPTIEVKQPDYQRNTLTVSGNAQLTVSPDKAEVYISVVSDNKTAKLAQENNRAVADEVMSALKALGLNASDVETETYALSKLEDYDSEKGRYVERGYRLTNTIKATTRQIDKVGDIIDASVGAGANGVDQISFGLTKDAEKKVRDDAMVKATEAAREKAQMLAKSSGAEIVKVITVNEQNFYYAPYEYNYKGAVMMDSAAGGAPPTAISPQKVEVTSSVNLVYEIK
jgi:uncharacterized protein